jgi:hypothetical protein
MSKQHWLSVLTVAIVLSSPSLLRAQTLESSDNLDSKLRSSHDLSKLPAPSGDLENLLKRGLADRRREELLKQLEKYPNIQEMVEKALKDPKAQEEIRNLLKNDRYKGLFEQMHVNPKDLEGNLTQENLQKLGETVKRYREQRESRMPNPAGTAPKQGDGQDTPDNTPRQPPSSTTPPPIPTPSTGSNEASSGGENRPALSPLAKNITSMSERILRFDTIRNSPSLQKAIRQLAQHLGSEDEKLDRLAQGASKVQAEFGRWSDSLGLDRWSWPKNWAPSWMSRFRWPSGLPSMPSLPARPSFGGLPNLGHPAPPTSGGLSWLLTLVGMIGLGFLVWRLLGHGGSSKDGKSGGRWVLGPWPVDPARIRSRAELVRAFEYLSLSNLGPDARHWHHRMLAERLGKQSATLGDEAHRLQAAHELAALYEHARYAPDEDVLPEQALVVARQDLCFLARKHAA